MSTPTTTLATLPGYHSRYHHSASYAHQHPHQGQGQSHSSGAAGTAANYCALPAFVLPPTTPSSTSAAAAAAAARLLPFYQPGSSAGSSSTEAIAQSQRISHGPQHSHLDDRRSQQQNSCSAPRHFESHAPTMSSTVAANDPSSRKRRRSREPDWNIFYRNGLPSEVIVIDDTPEPEANTGRKIVNANPNARDLTTHQVAKRVRRDDGLEPTTRTAGGYHVQYNGSHRNTPLQNSTPIGSTLSSARTNSALHTTAPTSLSSNSQHDDVQAPLKRKRTRQQVANEAKRRDIDGLGDAFFTYKPPPCSPKKAPNVPVRVVHDVRPSTDAEHGAIIFTADHLPPVQRNHDKNIKVDDEDGHYIVVPDAQLTDKCECLDGFSCLPPSA